MNGFRLICIVLAAIVAPILASGARAETLAYGPFKFDTDFPSTIRLDGALDGGSALAFRRALTAHPGVGAVALNSDGGQVQAGLLIADDVFARGLDTLVAAGDHCYSACAYIFLAGRQRLAKGELGVHQMSSDLPDLTSAQLSISDVIEQMARFDVPTEVLTIMFRTPSRDMHVFTAAEIERLGINRAAAPAKPAAVATATVPASSTIDERRAAETLRTRQATIAIPAIDVPSAPQKLAAIEPALRQPDRMAIYAGLDFFGGDVGSLSMPDPTSCAMACLERGAACHAFTFNIKVPGGGRPNCFLKSGKGRVDGNSAAVSGEMLDAAALSPSPYTLGVIDPETNIMRNVDLTGGDLSRMPYAKAKNPQQCRLACVAKRQCEAYTFASATRACWLKGRGVVPTARPGMVSGIKQYMTVSPHSVVSLK